MEGYNRLYIIDHLQSNFLFVFTEIRQLHDNNYSNICKRNKILGDLSRRKRSSSDDSIAPKRARNTTDV
jgi:hypothetical protein